MNACAVLDSKNLKSCTGLSYVLMKSRQEDVLYCTILFVCSLGSIIFIKMAIKGKDLLYSQYNDRQVIKKQILMK